MKIRLLAFFLAAMGATQPLLAGAVPEVSVVLHPQKGREGVVRAATTILHQAETPRHYIVRWELWTEMGDFLVRRDLAHHHADEQPFTRVSDPFSLPAGTAKVLVKLWRNDQSEGPDERLVILQSE